MKKNPSLSLFPLSVVSCLCGLSFAKSLASFSLAKDKPQRQETTEEEKRERETPPVFLHRSYVLLSQQQLVCPSLTSKA